MLRLGIPKKAIKGLSIRKKRDPKKNNKTIPNQEDGRSHHEPTVGQLRGGGESVVTMLKHLFFF